MNHQLPEKMIAFLNKLSRHGHIDNLSYNDKEPWITIYTLFFNGQQFEVWNNVNLPDDHTCKWGWQTHKPFQGFSGFKQQYKNPDWWG